MVFQISQKTCVDLVGPSTGQIKMMKIIRIKLFLITTNKMRTNSCNFMDSSIIMRMNIFICQRNRLIARMEYRWWPLEKEEKSKKQTIAKHKNLAKNNKSRQNILHKIRPNARQGKDSRKIIINKREIILKIRLNEK